MLKIGDFSKFGHVSVKTLRYYDDAGLLKPVHVDPWPNYRYYFMSPLPQLNRILALKHLGFTLEQMVPLLNDEVAPEHLRQLLEHKQAEIVERMEAERAVLARVEARLRQLEGATIMANYDVIVKRVNAQQVAKVRKVVPTVQDMVNFSFAMGDVLAAKQVQLAGPWLHVYYQDDYREADLDVETAVPIHNPAAVAGLSLPDGTPICVRELPGSRNHGFNRSSRGIKYVGARLCSNRRLDRAERLPNERTGPRIFLQEEGDPATYVTEIQFPVTRA